tara:strand:+ start:994 stop:1350 length:357 start_codon:yes stop_codon:yes gene_type:complete
MNFINHATIDVLQDYIISGKYMGGSGQTAEECWDTLVIVGMEKPDKDDFIKKVNERNVYYQMKELRRKRDKLLMECDWTQSRDITLTDDEAWIKYRQDLRDLPKTADLSNVEYPTKPI